MISSQSLSSILILMMFFSVTSSSVIFNTFVHFKRFVYNSTKKLKTITHVLDFCNECTSYNQYNIERVAELIHVRDFLLIVSSRCDYIDDNIHIRIWRVLDDISSMAINRNVGSLAHERKLLRVGFSHLLCLGKRYYRGADKWNKDVNSINEKKLLVMIK